MNQQYTTTLRLIIQIINSNLNNKVQNETIIRNNSGVCIASTFGISFKTIVFLGYVFKSEFNNDKDFVNLMLSKFILQ